MLSWRFPMRLIVGRDPAAEDIIGSRFRVQSSTNGRIDAEINFVRTVGILCPLCPVHAFAAAKLCIRQSGGYRRGIGWASHQPQQVLADRLEMAPNGSP